MEEATRGEPRPQGAQAAASGNGQAAVRRVRARGGHCGGGRTPRRARAGEGIVQGAESSFVCVVRLKV